MIRTEEKRQSLQYRIKHRKAMSLRTCCWPEIPGECLSLPPGGTKGARSPRTVSTRRTAERTGAFPSLAPAWAEAVPRHPSPCRSWQGCGCVHPHWHLWTFVIGDSRRRELRADEQWLPKLPSAGRGTVASLCDDHILWSYSFLGASLGAPDWRCDLTLARCLV
jgi:hypothetical protein